MIGVPLDQSESGIQTMIRRTANHRWNRAYSCRNKGQDTIWPFRYVFLVISIIVVVVIINTTTSSIFRLHTWMFSLFWHMSGSCSLIFRKLWLSHMVSRVMSRFKGSNSVTPCIWVWVAVQDLGQVWMQSPRNTLTALFDLCCLVWTSAHCNIYLTVLASI